MKIINSKITMKTRGNGDLINMTDQLSALLGSSKIMNGSLTVFVTGSTAGILTMEFEPGLIQDIKDLYEKIIPRQEHYKHDETWGDANGFSHLRASLQGPSLTIPFEDGRLFLGTWQQVVLADFDNRTRDREVVVHIMGE